MTEYYAMIFDTVDNRTLRVRKHDNLDDALKECEELKTFIKEKRSWLADRWRVQIMKVKVYDYQSDRTLSDDVLSPMNDIYEMVDDFITDAELEDEE